MKRVLKVLGLCVGGIVVLGLSLIGFAALRVEIKRRQVVVVNPPALQIPTDEASIEEGKRLVVTKACSDCHGSDLAGKTFVNEAPVGVFTGGNLTLGKGSRVVDYQVTDWIRALRLGIDPKGRPLIMMPSGDFHGLSNEEMAKMIAYLRALPPVDRENPAQSIGPVARVLYLFNQMPLLFSYESLDLHATPPESVTVESSVAYGKYLANGCIGCHGPGFSGGHVPGTPPDWPDAKNLTPTGGFAKWSLAEFQKFLSTGVTPEGHQVNPQFMPWTATAAMKDVEIEALYKFLKQVPAKAEGTR